MSACYAFRCETRSVNFFKKFLQKFFYLEKSYYLCNGIVN